MSQEKVDRYKEQKKNRHKIMRREKRERFLAYAAAALIAAVIVFWAGFSIYSNYEASKPASYTELDLSALTDYFSTLKGN